MAGLALGGAGMFAVMYATQAILPVLGRDFGVSPSQAGLTITVLIGAVAIGGWIWGPYSDRRGRKRSLVLASALLVLPTVGAAVAPTFEIFLACRALQGLCMPGLLTVGVPYVAEVYAPALGGRAMGYYLASLVAGGIVSRVGVGLITAAVGWRWAFAALAVLPAVGALVMRRLLPEAPAPAVSGSRRGALVRQLANPRLIAPTAGAAALFFTFVSIASYVTYRLEAPPFGYGVEATSAIFVLWVIGAIGPTAGRVADRIGWRRLLAGALGLALAGVALSLPETLPTVVLGLACVITAMFSGLVGAQLGLAAATSRDRGTASALYFTVYYVAGGLAAFVPGIAWEQAQWAGVAAIAAGVLAVGLALALAGPVRPAADAPAADA